MGHMIILFGANRIINIFLFGAHKNMPFSRKYSHIGKTKKVRIAEMVEKHFEKLQDEYDRICGAHDEDYLYKIMEKIEDGLDRVE